MILSDWRTGGGWPRGKTVGNEGPDRAVGGRDRESLVTPLRDRPHRSHPHVSREASA